MKIIFSIPKIILIINIIEIINVLLIKKSVSNFINKIIYKNKRKKFLYDMIWLYKIYLNFIEYISFSDNYATIICAKTFVSTLTKKTLKKFKNVNVYKELK